MTIDQNLSHELIHLQRLTCLQISRRIRILTQSAWNLNNIHIGCEYMNIDVYVGTVQDLTVSVQLNRERERRTALTTRPTRTTIPADGPTTGTRTAHPTTPPDHLHHPTRRQATAPRQPEHQRRGIRTTSYRGCRRRSFRRPSSTSNPPSSSSISPIQPATVPVTCPLTVGRLERPNSASPSLPVDIRTQPWRFPEPILPVTTSSAVAAPAVEAEAEVAPVVVVAAAAASVVATTTADSTTTSRRISRSPRPSSNDPSPPAPVPNSNLSSRSKSNRISSRRATAITVRPDRIGVRSPRPLASRKTETQNTNNTNKTKPSGHLSKSPTFPTILSFPSPSPYLSVFDLLFFALISLSLSFSLFLSLSLSFSMHS